MATDELEAKRVASIEETMRANGEKVEVPVQADYFLFSNVTKHYLPDGITYVEVKALNEGDKRQYLNKQNRELSMNRASQDTKMKLRPGDDRHNLLMLAVTGWNFKSNGRDVPFSEYERWLNQADPKIVEGIEKAINIANPWLLADMSIEDMKREIANLTEMLELKEREEEGKASSGNK